jgi:hypothetical protein
MNKYQFQQILFLSAIAAWVCVNQMAHYTIIH